MSFDSSLYGEDKKVLTYIKYMTPEEVVRSILNEYVRIKGTFPHDPYTGYYGCLEFAGDLLLWKYLRFNLGCNLKLYGTQMIPLADMFGCYFNCMGPEEWSNKMDGLIQDNIFTISYEEWIEIYNYLKSEHIDEIQRMPFNKGNRNEFELHLEYLNFIEIYNGMDAYNQTINYYTRQGLAMTDDMPFAILN